MPSLIATLGLDGSAFKANLDRAVGQASAAGDKITSSLSGHIGKALGAFAVAHFVKEGIKDAIEYGGNMFNVSQRVGIGTEAVLRWDYALKLNGSSIDSASGFFEMLAMNRDKALRGNEESIRSFKALGISIES